MKNALQNYRAYSNNYNRILCLRRSRQQSLAPEARSSALWSVAGLGGWDRARIKGKCASRQWFYLRPLYPKIHREMGRRDRFSGYKTTIANNGPTTSLTFLIKSLLITALLSMFTIFSRGLIYKHNIIIIYYCSYLLILFNKNADYDAFLCNINRRGESNTEIRCDTSIIIKQSLAPDR